MPVDVVSNISYSDFATQYLFPNKPVILTDAIKDWGASAWTPDFFKEKFGSREVEIDGKKWKVADYIDVLHASTADNPAPYMRNVHIGNNFPELVGDVTPAPSYFGPNWLHDKYFPERLDELMRTNSAVEVYIGGPGRTFPVIHYDSIYTHAYLSQVYGDKQLYLWGPDQTQFMYNTAKANVSAVKDFLNPDLEKFPLFAKAKGESIVLKPGQTLFVPGGWWHTALMLTESITISVNVANASNWSNVAKDVALNQSPIVRPALEAYMHLLGAVKRVTHANSA